MSTDFQISFTNKLAVSGHGEECVSHMEDA